MRMTERIAEIVELDSVNQYLTLVVDDPEPSVYPVYFGRVTGEQSISIPVTTATGIDDDLKETKPAHLLVADRMAGYEAYVLNGKARFVSEEEDFDLTSEMRNMTPGFPVHGAVVFEVSDARLAPPP